MINLTHTVATGSLGPYSELGVFHMSFSGVVANMMTDKTFGDYSVTDLQIELADDLKEIPENTFVHAMYLVGTVKIPGSITKLSTHSFARCFNIVGFEVVGGETYASVDGVVYDHAVTELIIFPSGKAGEYHIPDTVTTINLPAEEFPLVTEFTTSPGNTHFRGDDGVLVRIADSNNVTALICPRLKTGDVAIRDDVKTIGYVAFADCNLGSITMGPSVALIVDYAFNKTKYEVMTINFNGLTVKNYLVSQTGSGTAPKRWFKEISTAQCYTYNFI